MMHQSDMSTMNNINYYNYNKYNNVINNNKIHTFRISEYSETLFKVDTKYVPVKGVGEGAYGVVCSCIDTKTNEKVAIKKIMNVFDDGVAAVRALRELKILRYVRHDNVIALKDVMITSSKSNFKDIYLVYELMDTDLDRIIRSNQLLSHDHVKYFMFQLLRGLNHLHSANILHRDLKPKNLLINANCDLKICDFGLARTNNGGRGQSMTEYVVTRWYRAPELLLNCDNYGPSIDVWSVGCIFAELLGRRPIFPGKDPLDQIKWIIHIVGTPDHSNLAFVKKCRELKFLKSLPYSSGQMMLSLFPKADPFALNLLWKMLEFDPRKRITVSEALKHPYFSDLYDPNSLGTAPFPCDLDMDANIGVDKIRSLIWNEMSLYHPEPPVHLSSRLRYSWDDDAHYF